MDPVHLAVFSITEFSLIYNKFFVRLCDKISLFIKIFSKYAFSMVLNTKNVGRTFK